MGLLDFLKKKAEPQKINPSKTTPSAQFRSEVERDMYEQNLCGYQDLKDSLDFQNRLLSRVNAAQQRFREDGDLDAVIKELEYAFIEADPPCKTSQNMDLVNYYLKAGQNDKAWGYLNRLLQRQDAPLKDIRFAQARLLKKEKKWADAIEMYMLGYLAKSEWNNTFQEEMFIKDIKSSANKLGWDDTIISKLAGIVKGFVSKRKYDEKSLIQEYRKFYSSL